MTTVYIIHLSEKISDRAQHYTGSTDDLEGRLDEHAHTVWHGPNNKTGSGAVLLGVANVRNIPWELARVWNGVERDFEYKVKAWKNARLLCPVCNPATAYNHLRGSD